MRRLSRLLGEERGFALVLALAVTFVLSMTVVTVIESATSNSRSSDRSKGRVSAYSLAEAGINNASSILSKSNSYDPHLLHPQGSYSQGDCASPPANPTGAALLGNTCSPYTWNYDGGTTTMWGWFDSNTANWTITSTGSVRNAFGGAATSRTLTATVHVRPAPSQDNYVTAWNYVFVRDTTPGVCNLHDAELIERQHFALHRRQPLFPEFAYCGGGRYRRRCTSGRKPRNARQNRLAERAQEGRRETRHQLAGQRAVTTAKVAGGCASALAGARHTCSSPGDYFYVQAAWYTTTAPAITTPVLTDTDFTDYYGSTYIRPGDRCDNPGPNGGNRLPNTTFDNDTTALNGTGGNGSAATFDLTPTRATRARRRTAGSCASPSSLGQHDKILKIRGTIYFDGSLTISQAGIYHGVNSAGDHPSGDLTGKDGIGGQAVIYASGSLLPRNSAMCGWDTAHDHAAKSGSATAISRSGRPTPRC